MSVCGRGMASGCSRVKSRSLHTAIETSIAWIRTGRILYVTSEGASLLFTMVSMAEYRLAARRYEITHVRIRLDFVGCGYCRYGRCPGDGVRHQI